MSFRALVLVIAAAAAFLYVSSASLPPVVASHFVAHGTANGFMPRSAYLSFMAMVVVGLPLLLGFLFGLAGRLPPSLVNVPNRGYWLAPERVEETRTYLGRQGHVFAALLVGFLCFVHWQVVEANRAQPPRLPERAFVVGLVLFLLATVAWAAAFIARFRRPRA